MLPSPLFLLWQFDKRNIVFGYDIVLFRILAAVLQNNFDIVQGGGGHIGIIINDLLIHCGPDVPHLHPPQILWHLLPGCDIDEGALDRERRAVVSCC